MTLKICRWLLFGVFALLGYLLQTGADEFYSHVTVGVSFGLAIPCILSWFEQSYRHANGTDSKR